MSNAVQNAIAEVLQYSGLDFVNLEHKLANVVVEAAELSDDDATYDFVLEGVKSGIEAVAREVRMSGKVVRLERSAELIAQAVA